jgi:hypothetical protein
MNHQQTVNARESGPTPIVTSERIRVGRDTVRIGAPLESHRETHGEPRVVLVREEGVIRAIDVICGCGERIRVRCDYA